MEIDNLLGKEAGAVLATLGGGDLLAEAREVLTYRRARAALAEVEGQLEAARADLAAEIRRRLAL